MTRKLAIALAALGIAATAAPAAQAWTVDAREQALIAQINEHRAAKGLPAVQIDGKLVKAADLHTGEMFAHDYFGHQSVDGSGFSKRVWKFTKARKVGEILAIAHGIDPDTEARQVMAAWLGSAAHRAAIESPKYTRVGIARGVGTLNGAETLLVTVDFSSTK